MSFTASALSPRLQLRSLFLRHAKRATCMQTNPSSLRSPDASAFSLPHDVLWHERVGAGEGEDLNHDTMLVV